MISIEELDFSGDADGGGRLRPRPRLSGTGGQHHRQPKNGIWKFINLLFLFTKFDRKRPYAYTSLSEGHF